MPNTRTSPYRSSLARLARRTALALAGGAVLAGLVGVPAASARDAPAKAPSAGGLPAGFEDCPALPAGADPARWRCEVHTAAPRLIMGTVTVTLAPITMTHAEGPLPDGTPGQVWGAMHTTPTAVPGGLTGRAPAGRGPLALTLLPEYGGRSDFYTGRFSLRFRLLSPLLPRTCAVGADTPVDFEMKRSGPSRWISTDPPVIEFSAYDDAFTAPAAEDCGPLTSPLNRRLGLPAPAGKLLSYDASYTFRTYDQLSIR